MSRVAACQGGEACQIGEKLQGGTACQKGEACQGEVKHVKEGKRVKERKHIRLTVSLPCVHEYLCCAIGVFELFHRIKYML